MRYSIPMNIARYTNGILIKLTASAEEFISYDYDPDSGEGSFLPETITISADYQGGVKFGKWQMSTDGAQWKDAAGSADSITIRPTGEFFGAGNAVTIRCIGNDPQIYDTITILRSTDPLVIYRKTSTKIDQTNEKIALIASEEELEQFTTGETLVGKVAQIEETAEGFRQTVEATYTTKQYTDDKVADLESDATAKANAAQSAAISAASADATSKANAAKADAQDYTDGKLTNYSTTLQMKSEIEQSAASIRQSVSKTYVTSTTFESRMTDMEEYADSAAGDALESAKADATSKANSAQQTAISTAAADATSKANAAQSAAISAASADATTKADAAKSAAITTAAQDATTKATGALNDAKDYTNGQLESYSTTAQMTTAIEQSASDLRLYAAKVSTINPNLYTEVNAEYDKVLRSNGTLLDSTSRNYITSDFIPAKAETKHTLQVWTWDVAPNIYTKIVFFDDSKTAIGALPSSSTSVYSDTNTDHAIRTFTTPANTSFVRFSHGNNTTGRGWAKLEEGDEPTQYSSSPTEGGKVNDQYAGINVTIDGINTEVAKKVGNSEIISRINQSAESVQIDAAKININGVISANGNFEVNTDGTIKAVNAEMTGLIYGSEIYATSFSSLDDPTIEDDSQGHISISGTEMRVYDSQISFANGGFAPGDYEGNVYIKGRAMERYVEMIDDTLWVDSLVSALEIMSKYWISFRMNNTEWMSLASTAIAKTYGASDTYYNYNHMAMYAGINCYATTTCHRSFRTIGTKNRLVEGSYGDRLLYSYETPTPQFGDIGFGRTDSDGLCVVMIDEIYRDTIESGAEYAVFLQKEGQGDIWVDRKEDGYFVVKGTPDLPFSWEMKGVQKGFHSSRLDEPAIVDEQDFMEEPDGGLDLDKDLADYDKEMEDIFK